MQFLRYRDYVTDEGSVAVLIYDHENPSLVRTHWFTRERRKYSMGTALGEKENGR